MAKNDHFWAILGYFGLSRARKLRRGPFPKFSGSAEAEIAQNSPKWSFLTISVHFGYIVLCSQNVQKMAKNDNFWAILGYFCLSRARKLRRGPFPKFSGSREAKIAQKWHYPKQSIPRTMIEAHDITCASLAPLAMFCLKISRL